MKRMSIYIIILLLLFGVGCATLSGKTKPNPINTQYPGYGHLAQKNPLLAEEIGRLPELQDGVSAEDARTLEKILNIYNANSNVFDSAFKDMYSTGIPSVREYDSLLQAVYWLCEDGKELLAEKLIANYSIENLLNASWIVDQTQDRRHKERWDKLEIVTSRLNAPELIDNYTKRFFKYYNPGLITRHYSVIFRDKKGHCYDYSLFIQACLLKAGYKAYIYDQPYKPHKFVGYVGKDGKWYVIDNGKFVPKGISGPFESANELKKTLSCERYYGPKKKY